jgi:hypothetical protein
MKAKRFTEEQIATVYRAAADADPDGGVTTSASRSVSVSRNATTSSI